MQQYAQAMKILNVALLKACFTTDAKMEVLIKDVKGSKQTLTIEAYFQMVEPAWLDLKAKAKKHQIPISDVYQITVGSNAIKMYPGKALVTNKTTEKVTLLGKTILENRADQSMLIVLEQGKAKIKGVISTMEKTRQE